MPQITLLIFPLLVRISSLGNSHNNFSPWIHIHSVIHISYQKYIKSWNLTRKHRCESPTCNRSSTLAPLLLLLHHVCGPSCKSQVYLINFPHSRKCFIITISTTNKSFFQSFLSTFFFLISLIITVVLCPILVIIPFFIFGLSLSNCYCLVFELLLSDLSSDF
jgi:hypothetical protein